jgi:hypothetical protein
MKYENKAHTVTVSKQLVAIPDTGSPPKTKNCSRLQILTDVSFEDEKKAAERLMGTILGFSGGCDKCKYTYCFRCCPLKGDVDVALTPVDIQEVVDPVTVLSIM